MLHLSDIIGKHHTAIKRGRIGHAVAAQRLGGVQQMGALSAARMRFVIQTGMRQRLGAARTQARRRRHFPRRLPAQHAAADPFGQMVIQAVFTLIQRCDKMGEHTVWGAGWLMLKWETLMPCYGVSVHDSTCFKAF